MSTCTFIKAWIGPCSATSISPNVCRCVEHAKTVCVSCGEPATKECAETGAFVCGEPLCDKCEHTIHPNGCNSGPLPKGVFLKQHRPKGTQIFQPWFNNVDTKLVERQNQEKLATLTPGTY